MQHFSHLCFFAVLYDVLLSSPPNLSFSWPISARAVNISCCIPVLVMAKSNVPKRSNQPFGGSEIPEELGCEFHSHHGLLLQKSAYIQQYPSVQLQVEMMICKRLWGTCNLIRPTPEQCEKGSAECCVDMRIASISELVARTGKLRPKQNIHRKNL
jgi:hypothetical protein